MLGPVEELLVERGAFSELTVGEIIARAGVKRSTFYYHYRDKADLLIEISSRAIKEIVDASYGLYTLDGRGTRTQFERRVADTVAVWRPHVPLMSALAEVAVYDERVAAQFQTGWQAAQKGIHDHIVAGQRAGYVRADADPDYTAAWLTWMAERGMGQVVFVSTERDFKRIVAALAGVVWHTLYERS